MTPALLLLFALSVPPSAQQSSAKPAVEQKEPSAPAALSELEALTKRNPDDPKGWVLLGLAYLDRNDYPRALDAFQHAVKVGPESAEAHNWLGVALAEKSDVPSSFCVFM